MKKSAVIILILFLFPLIQAVEWDMKTEFQQGEMLTAKISGNFIKPILKENIYLYRGHVRVSADPSVAKIEDDYYIAISLLGKTESNYTLMIKEVEYMIGGKTESADLERNFTIKGETALFSIDKGFVITSGDFSIQVQNLQAYLITINVKTDTVSGSSSEGFFSSLFEKAISDSDDYFFNLKSGEIKKINFEVNGITKTSLKKIKFSSSNLSYEIPIYVYANKSAEVEKGGMKFDFSESNISVATGDEKTRFVYLHNLGEETLKDITLSVSEELSSYLTLSVEEIEELEAGSKMKIDFDLFSEEEGTIEGYIKAELKDNETILTYYFLTLNFIKDYIPPANESFEENGGGPSSQNQTIANEKSSTGKIIGWSLLALIVGGLVWFYFKKYKKAGTGPIDLFKRKK
ncbi:MAG: hypothetical protein ABH804_00370 [archaeon]